MARKEKGVTTSRLREIVTGKGGLDIPEFIGEAVAHAMTIRESPAALRTPHGIGMVVPYRHTSIGFQELGVMAVLITPDKIFAEKHFSHGVQNVEKETNQSECSSYELPLATEDLNVIGDFTRQDDPLVQAAEFANIVRTVAGEGYIAGRLEVPSEEKQAVHDLIFMLDHGFANPFIEELVSVALREES